jgi:hypothetical protein
MLPMEWWWPMLFASSGLSKVEVSGKKSVLRLFHPLRHGTLRMCLSFVITLIVIGVLLGLVNRFIPMQSNIKSILNGIVVIAVVLWIVNLFGLFSSISRIHVGR